jgi:hypothetical protein
MERAQMSMEWNLSTKNLALTYEQISGADMMALFEVGEHISYYVYFVHVVMNIRFGCSLFQQAGLLCNIVKSDLKRPVVTVFASQMCIAGCLTDPDFISECALESNRPAKKVNHSDCHNMKLTFSLKNTPNWQRSGRNPIPSCSCKTLTHSDVDGPHGPDLYPLSSRAGQIRGCHTFR